MGRKWTEEQKKEKSISQRNAMRNSDRYKNCKHHQLESDEERKAYHREYQRKWRLAHPDYYNDLRRKRLDIMP